MKKQQGVSLIELLIAMALGLLIISGVVRMVSHSINNERLLSAEIEIQENLNYINNRLSFIFKESLSSPCGDLDEMMDSNKTDKFSASLLKRAMIGKGSNGKPQDIPNVIMPSSAALPANTDKATVFTPEFPLLAVGIAGDANEPLDKNQKAISTLLTDIKKGDQYIVVMETSEKVVLDLTRLKLDDKDSALGVTGGKNAGGALKVSEIPTSVIASKTQNPMPYIITNCKQGDIFVSKADTNDPIKRDVIFVEDNLFFSSITGGFQPAQTIISPIEMYAYYIARPAGEEPQFARVKLNVASPTRQSLVGGVTDMQFEWGLGADNQVQAYFSTQQLLDNNAVRTGNFRSDVISVRVTTTAKGFNNKYRHAKDENNKQTELSRTVQRVYTIRNKMLRI